MERLEELSDQAIGNLSLDPTAPIGADFVFMGYHMLSQQLALVGLIYARERGKLVEIPELSFGHGPLYVLNESPLVGIKSISWEFLQRIVERKY